MTTKASLPLKSGIAEAKALLPGSSRIRPSKTHLPCSLRFPRSDWIVSGLHAHPKQMEVGPVALAKTTPSNPIRSLRLSHPPSLTASFLSLFHSCHFLLASLCAANRRFIQCSCALRPERVM